jgi:hypothetical protein
LSIADNIDPDLGDKLKILSQRAIWRLARIYGRDGRAPRELQIPNCIQQNRPPVLIFIPGAGLFDFGLGFVQLRLSNFNN